VQILADEAGSVVCLGERECSIQRNHRSFSRSPLSGVDAVLRTKLTETAVRAARAAGYVGAGTVEFLLDEERNFYLWR
jgi:acetyl/propionyl-CoA carboxylase alpha subunit